MWFEGGKTLFHLGKKVPPKGRALIYALAGHRDTPLDFARACVGSISTFKPKTSLRRYPLDNVGIQNCDGRAWVKWIFKVNYQTREKEFLQEVMLDFLYSINVDKGRLEEYEVFIPKMREKVDSWIEEEKGDPEIEYFLSQMQKRLGQVEREYWGKMHDSPAADHLKAETEVIQKLQVLIEEDGAEFHPEACYLLDQIQLWSDIESVPGRVGGLLREMFQKAGYGCALNTELVRYAEEIRRDIREFLITGETHEVIYPSLWD